MDDLWRTHSCVPRPDSSGRHHCVPEDGLRALPGTSSGHLADVAPGEACGASRRVSGGGAANRGRMCCGSFANTMRWQSRNLSTQILDWRCPAAKSLEEHCTDSAANLNFAATAMLAPYAPFYPGSYHLGEGRRFAIGTGAARAGVERAPRRPSIGR